MKKMLLSTLICTALIVCGTAAHANSKATMVIITLLLLDEESGAEKLLGLSWQRPVQREDNTALSEAEIKTYRIRYRKAGSSNPYRFAMAYPPQLTTTLAITGAPGDQFQLSIQAIDQDGLASNYTDDVLIDYPEP